MARIAIITPEYPGARPSFGGIASQYATLGPVLVDLGEEVHTFVIAAEKGSTMEREGVVIHPVPVPPRTGPLFALARGIATRRSVGRLPKFDVVVVADWSGNGALLGEAADMRVVTHLHTCLALYLRISTWQAASASPAGLRTRLQLYLERRQAERSTAILACSNAILSVTSEFWGIESLPSTVLPNVVDPQLIRSLARAQPESRMTIAGTPVIAAPGRLETRKGAGVLMRAMRAVWDEYPDAILIFSGSDGIVEGQPARARITELAGRRADKIVFAGVLPSNRLFAMLSDADVVVTPSLWEAFGIVTLEAMALGKRVVATTGSGYAEFCRDGFNSILVSPSAVDELARGILDALASDARALEGPAAATAEEFGVRRRAPEYQGYLQSIAGFT